MENAKDQLAENVRPSDTPGPKTDAENRQGPYEHSLIGKYSRILLLIVVVPLLIWFAQLAFNQHVSASSIVAIAVLLTSLLTTRGIASLRVFLIIAMTFNVVAIVINPDSELKGQDTDPLAVPNLILLICLFVASCFEVRDFSRNSSSNRQTTMKFLFWMALVIPALGYIVGMPVMQSVWESITGEAWSSATRDPNWTLAKEIMFRAAKFVVFAFFTYLGACIGSFLNVVAHCIPRGESIGLRDSSCPKCNAKIKRTDNLPIFSYVNLSARCRSCNARIPARYLLVELQVAFIFGSLFLYELVTGAANIPAMGTVSYSGILWIILYPKWPIIGIYFFHCFFMSFLVVLSLIEWDKQKIGLRYSVSLPLAFLISAAAIMPLQPIPAPEFLTSVSGGIPAVAHIAKLVFGAAVMIAIASCLGAKTESLSTFVPAMALSGIVLGWQSALHVTALFVLLTAIVYGVPRLRRVLSSQPTFILLAAIMIHHPLWKIIYQQLSF